MPTSDPHLALDRTYEALVRGDLSALQPLTAELGALSELRGLDRATAERIRKKAERNVRLLEAAARGLRTARRRLAEISAEPALTTYDARGRRESVGQVSPHTPRRF